MNDYSTLKVPFPGHEKLSGHYSQSHQDLFVLSVLNGKKHGTYLELGCGHPIDINNTYLLEKEFGWRGMSFDIDGSKTQLFKSLRANKAIEADCTNLNFDSIINELGTDIDYLSLDLEPNAVTWDCLHRIPFGRLNFKVITFEHDKYRFGPDVQKRAQELLLSHGYSLIVEDVADPIESPFEDWYIKDSGAHCIDLLAAKLATSKDVVFRDS